MTDERSKPPPLTGKANRQWLATCFGSVDGTLRGIKDRFDRQRCEARIAYQERGVAQWRRDVCFENGSPDGTYERLPPEKYEAAMLQIQRNFDGVQAACRDDLDRPALLRAKMDDLLDPWGDDNE